MSKNGLNFRHQYNQSSSIRLNIEQALDLKRKRIEEKENSKTNDLLIQNLCEIKHNYIKSRSALPKSSIFICSCWHIHDGFIDRELKDNFESDGNKELNMFNPSVIQRFRTFLNRNAPNQSDSDTISWELFSVDENVCRHISQMQLPQLQEQMAVDIFSDKKFQAISNDNRRRIRDYFDLLRFNCNGVLLRLLANMCRRVVTSFSISIFDLALLYSLRTLKSTSQQPEKLFTMDSRPQQNPLVYVVRCKSVIDYFLLPLIFREAGMEPPVFIVSECDQSLRIRAILYRIGYIFVKASCRNDDTFKFVLKQKLTMLLTSNKCLCVVQSAPVNSFLASHNDDLFQLVTETAVSVYLDGKVHDPVIVPLLLSHEFIPTEFQSRSESVWSCNSLMSMSMLAAQFGVVKLSVSRPTYYSQFCSGVTSTSATRYAFTDTNSEDSSPKVTQLRRHVSLFGYREEPVMPTNLVAFVLLYCGQRRTNMTLSGVEEAATEVVRFLLEQDSLYFDSAPLCTIVRRGCITLSHLLGFKETADGDVEVTVDYASFTVCRELSFYADVVVHSLLFRAAAGLSFVNCTKYDPENLEYTDDAIVNDEAMNQMLSDITKKLLVRFFQFHLPCEKLDLLVESLKDWWNDTMSSVTRGTDSQWLRTAQNSGLSRTMEYWSCAGSGRCRRLVTCLARCLGPRLEMLSHVLAQLMLNKPSSNDNQLETLMQCSLLLRRVTAAMQTAAVEGTLKFRESLNPDFLISSLVSLHEQNILQIYDSGCGKVLSGDWVDPNLNLTGDDRYEVTETNFFHLYNYKGQVELALMHI